MNALLELSPLPWFAVFCVILYFYRNTDSTPWWAYLYVGFTILSLALYAAVLLIQQ